MPRSASKKSTEAQEKKSSENNNEEEKKSPLVDKEAENVYHNETEKEVSPPPELPPKPPRRASGIPKLKKTYIAEEKRKKSGSVIIDKVPKKSAQRVKGTTSLGKSREKARTDSAGKKRPPSSPSPREKIIRPNMNEETVVTPHTSPPKNTEKPIRSNRKVKESKPDVKEEKGKKRKPWVSVLEKDSQEFTDEERENMEEKPMQEAPKDLTKITDIPSCSFFEKIQQGVKAYFSFRNTFKDYSGREDPNKEKVTEGGLQTSAGLAKGYKEEKKKRKRKIFKYSRIKLKNQINTKEYWLNPRRSNLTKSNSGGQITIFSKNIPNNLRQFQKLKHIKLYTPKKHYVRIQIPRKGYFYRSISQHKDQNISPASCVHRVESSPKQEISPKIENHTFAPAVVKVTRNQKKKVNKLNQKLKSFQSTKEMETGPLTQTRSKEDNKISKTITDLNHFTNLLQSHSSHYPSFVPKYVGDFSCLNTITVDYTKSLQDFFSVKEKTITGTEEHSVTPKIIDEREKYGRRTVSENSLNQINFDEKNQILTEKVMNLKQILSELSILDFDVCNNYDLSKTPQKKSSLTSFNTLFKCLNSGLPMNEFSFKVEIPDYSALPENSFKSESGPTNNFPLFMEPFRLEAEELKSTQEEFLPTVCKNVFENNDCHPLPEKQPWLSALSLIRNDQKYLENTSEDNITAALIGNIDLHSELQNYLKNIDVNITKTRTKNTLQQSHFIYPDALEFTNIKHEFKDLNFAQNKSKIDSETRFHDVTEVESNFSFNSALSHNSSIPKQEGDANNLNVFPKKKGNTSSFSEELLNVHFDKTFASEVSFLSCKIFNGKEDLRKIKSENDPVKPLPDVKSDSLIKRTFGNTSFQLLNLKKNKPTIPNIFIQNQLLQSLHSLQKSSLEFDSYEKIIPLVVDSFENKEKKAKIFKVLHEIPSTSLSEILQPNVQNLPLEINPIVRSDTQQSQKSEEPEKLNSETKTTPPIEKSEEPEKLISETKMTPPIEKSSVPEENKHWSPSLLELIDIYNAVLKNNEKLKNSPKNSLKRDISSLMFSFLVKKLTERKHKSDLIELYQNISRTIFQKSDNLFEKFKPSKKELTSQLVEYVNLCQEILLSSLSINQITQLNNILANVPKSFNNKENVTKSPTTERKKEKNEKKKFENKPSKPITPDVSKTSQKKFGVKISEDTKKFQNKTESVKPMVLQKKILPPKIEKPKKSKSLPKCNTKKCELSPPPELEPILKLCFNNYKMNRQNEDKPKAPLQTPNARNKFSVTVKLSNGKVFIDKIRNVENKKNLTTTKTKNSNNFEETSELIFENVSINQNNKCKSPTTLKEKKEGTKKEPSNQKMSTIKGIQKSKNISEEIAECESDVHEEDVEKKIQEKESLNTFEYNQQLLKVQHPINAIAENSEPKLNEGLKLEKEIPKEPKELQFDGKQIDTEEFSNNSEPKKILVNDLEEKSTSLNKTNEANLFNNTTHSPVVNSGKKFFEDTCEKTTMKNEEKKKFMDDTALDRSVNLWKTRKVLQVKPYTTYFCYSSYQNLCESKAIKSKKTTRDSDFGQRDRKPNKSPYSGFLKVTSSERSRQSVLTKKLSKDSNFKIPKTETKKYEGNLQVEKPNNENELELSRNENKNTQSTELSSKVSTNTILFLNTEISPEKCSVEFIFNDKEKNESLNIKPQSSSTDPREKFLKTEIQKVLDTFSISESSEENGSQEPSIPSTSKANTSQNASAIISSFKIEKLLERPLGLKPLTPSVSLEPTFPSPSELCTRKNSTVTLGSHQNSPLIIHSSKAENDEASFPALMIQSDSFLKCHSSFALTKSKFKALFKSNSDIQFYPGRISDSEERPLITFVLTPKQKTNAGVPSKQVTVVDRLEAEKLENCSPNAESEDQNPLESVEKFINILSKISQPNKGRKKIQISQPQRIPKITKNTNSIPKCFMPCQRLQALLLSNERPCHESKRKTRTVEPKINCRREIKNKGNSIEMKKECVKNRDHFKRDQNVTNGIHGIPESALLSEPEGSSGENPKYLKYELCSETVDENYTKQLAEGDMFCESSPKLFKKCIPSKKVKRFKIKIHCCNRHLDFRLFKPTKSPQNQKMVLEKKVIPKRMYSSSNLNFSDSTNDNSSHNLLEFFDAPEDTLEESHKKSKQISSLESVNGTLHSTGYLDGETNQDVSGNHSSRNLKSVTPVTLTSSDESLLSNPLTPELEYRICNKIIKSLQSNKVCYSMLLLEGYLKLIETNRDRKIVYFEKLRDIVRIVENKSQNLIDDLEKRGWLKIFAILVNIEEEFKKEYSASKTESWMFEFLNFMEKQLKSTQILLDKIQQLKDKKLDLQNLSSGGSLSNSSDAFGNRRSFLFKVRQWFKRLRDKFNIWSQMLIKSSLENVANNNEDSERVEELNQTFEKHSEKDLEFLVQSLKKQLGEQKGSVEYHIKNSPVYSEVNETKMKVAVILTQLEKIICRLDEYLVLEKNMENPSRNPHKKVAAEESSSSVNKPSNNEKSFLNLSFICKSWLEKSVSSDGNSAYPETNPNTTFKYPNFMKTFMKIWDVRTFDSSMSNVT